MTGYVYLPNNNNLIVNKLSGNVVTYNNEILTNELGETINGIADYMSYAIVGDNTQIIGNVFDNDALLNDIRTSKINEIDLGCKSAITGGFISSAYQSISKTYTSDLESQTNIVGNAFGSLSKMIGTVGCENDTFYYHAENETEFVEYQPTECLQLARDWKLFKQTQLVKEKQIFAYINNTTRTEAELNAVSWNMTLPILVASINLDKTSIDLIIGTTNQVTATIMPINTTNGILNWSSSDNTIATVDQTGLITGIKVGSITIIVTSTDNSNVSQSISINVVATA